MKINLPSDDRKSSSDGTIDKGQSVSLEMVKLSPKDDISLIPIQRIETDSESKPENIKHLLEQTLTEELITGESIDDIMNMFKKYKIYDFVNLTQARHNQLINESKLDLGNFYELIFKRENSREKPFSIPFSSAKMEVSEFGDCDNKYFETNDYSKTILNKQGIKLNEYQRTLENASKIEQYFRGRAARWDIVLILILTIGFVFCLGLGLILGRFISYYFLLGFGCLYFGSGILSLIFIKKHCFRLYIHGLLSLSLFLRSENKNVYNSRFIVLRSGYYAKWIEFIKHEVKEEIIP